MGYVERAGIRELAATQSKRVRQEGVKRRGGSRGGDLVAVGIRGAEAGNTARCHAHHCVRWSRGAEDRCKGGGGQDRGQGRTAAQACGVLLAFAGNESSGAVSRAVDPVLQAMLKVRGCGWD